jgi:hypothetical protein
MASESSYEGLRSLSNHSDIHNFQEDRQCSNDENYLPPFEVQRLDNQLNSIVLNYSSSSGEVHKDRPW